MLQVAILTVEEDDHLLYLGVVGRFGNPDARPLGAFEIDYKMVASDGECSISTILREHRAL